MMPDLRASFFQHVAQTSPAPDGFEVSRGDGIYLFDTHGNRYIDCISGIAVSSLGHNHPNIKKAIRHQLDLHLHTMVYGEHIQLPQVALAERLAGILPDQLQCIYFTNSGTEAVEGALKLARKFTSRFDIVACRHAYHGSTAGAESLRSDLWHTSAMRPLVPGIHHIDFNSFEHLAAIDESTAAIILEPIQGEAGVILPSPGYLAAVRKRCNETGTLLILDEIQTGMGRTGSMWAFEQEDIVPDILLAAKAFGGGLPLGAFISNREIMSMLSHDPVLSHLTTFGGHPLSCAASLAAIDVLTDESLAEKALPKGHAIKQSLTGHPAVKEIRGRGLMLAIELKHADHLIPMVHACRQVGLLVDWFLFNTTSIRLAPPLIMKEDEIKVMCEKLESALNTLQ